MSVNEILLTSNVFNIGTFSRRLSYILRFLHADLSRMRLKVVRSIAQSEPLVVALMVAARG